MNERIKELAKQSGAMFDHMTWVERDLAPVFERFAELIVRECCVTADANIDDSKYPSYWIKKKFGVKE